jgi:hypothetical protein
MVLVGLGADEKTKRMALFLSESDLDISLTTFHGFKKGEDIFLARQVEVQPPDSTTAFTKKSNLEKLRLKVKGLGLENYYYDIASLFRNQLPPSYEWPNPGGYSYSLPELTESGSQSNRVYIALFPNPVLSKSIFIIVQWMLHQVALRDSKRHYISVLTKKMTVATKCGCSLKMSGMR